MVADLTGAEWFKSSYSGGDGDCVEAAWLCDGQIGVRDSKDPAGPALRFDCGTWAAFTTDVRRGRFGSDR